MTTPGVSHPRCAHHDGALLTPLAAEALALLLYGPLVIVWHELGHAALARAGGFRVIHFAVGHGAPLLRLGTVAGARIWIGRWILSGGQCSAIPLGPVRSRRAWFHAGGLIAQVVLAGLLALLPDWWWVQRVALFNVLVAVMNAVPWRFRGTGSDGWYLWDLWRGGRGQAEILPQRRALLRLRDREQQVASPLGLAWSELCLAWGDAVAGRTEGTLDEQPLFADEPYLAALSTYVRAEQARRRGDAATALSLVEQARPARGDDGEPLLALARAGALLDLDRPARARAALADLLDGPDVMVRQALVHLLRAAIADDPDEVESATWRVTRHHHRSWLDPIETANTLVLAADVLQGRGRVQAAEGTREVARLLALRTVQTCHADHVAAVRRRLDRA